MWTKNFKKAQLILCLTWLLCLLSDPADCAKRQQFVSPLRKQQPIKRQNTICLNQAPEDFVEHPENCRLFYLCKADGQAVVASCPPTMLFNPESKLCDKASNVNCRTNIGTTIDNQATSTTTSSTTIPFIPTTTSVAGANEIASATRFCAALPPQQEMERLTFIGSSSSCQRYYICYYGQALLQECSANLHWNANIGKCDMPAHANCRLQQNNNNNNNNNNNSNNNNNNNNSGSITDQFINCPNYGQHIFPHLARCDFFIYCVKGHATLQQCPFYYYFDIVTKSCKWRTTAVCVRDLNIDFQKAAKF